MPNTRIDQILLLLPALSSWLIARVLTNDLMLMVLITAVLALAGIAVGYLLVQRLQGKQFHVKVAAAVVVFVLVFLLPVLVDTALDFYWNYR
ncbi:hypothetical protein [Pontibacter roseus]|uniref:hypothetical protein n=1 Tax=Pontibacter roseus TaxID=336989 RepID=UPI00036C3908|nr:hypothetical protein [Pontibacter roseus]